jgi:arylformamidase
MGVAGSGKTTIGRALARRLGWELVDADDFHAPEAVSKMSRGIPLDDADRAPWLAHVAAELRARLARGMSVVLACSALKESHRAVLAGGDERRVSFVLLSAPRDVLAARLAERRGHFFSPELLGSQLATLDPPAGGVAVEAARPVPEVVEAVLAAAGLESGRRARGGWADVTVPLRNGMVHWPGDPAIEVTRVLSLEKGDPATLSAISMGAHTGTHVDAPCHFIEGGATLDAIPFDAFLGPARVLAIEDPVAVTPEELSRHRVRRGERLLFKTRNSERAWSGEEFHEDFVPISLAAAGFLAARGVRLVGVDYLSVGGFAKDGKETHVALLAAGVWILEGLDLSRVAPGRVDLVCLPIRLAGADGAPARVLVRERKR